MGVQSACTTICEKQVLEAVARVLQEHVDSVNRFGLFGHPSF